MRHRSARLLVLALALALLGASLLPAPAVAASGDFTFFPGGAVNVNAPLDITAGPDGNLWFTSYLNSRIGRISPGGTIVTFVDAESEVVFPTTITPGPDGALWFTSEGNNRIGRVTVGGDITTFEDVDGEVMSPRGITTGPDGALWFTSYTNDRIGRITTAGEITTFPDVDIDGPWELVTGADGNLWFTNLDGGSIGRMTTGGVVDVFTHVSVTTPAAIAAGPDGNVWVTATGTSTISRVTPTGVITPFFDPGAGTQAPTAIDAGPDGNMWFSTVGSDPDVVGRITPAGLITTFEAPEIQNGGGVTAGPDGSVWFTSVDNDTIGRVSACLPPSFSDVPASSIFLNDICWMAEHGISTGFPGNLYKPAAAVTRQAMSAFMFRLAGTPPFTPPAEATFNDVPTTSQFFDEIEWMADEGITTGFPGDLYKPGQAVTRQAMSAFMYRLAGSPSVSPPGSPTFDDVGVTSQFYVEIEWMAAEEITTGFPGDLYRPGAAVTRQAMSAFMNRLAPLL